MMRRVTTAALALLGAAMIATAAAPIPTRSAEPGVPILLYHRFSPSVPGSTTVTTPAFEEQLGWLAEHHYTVARLASVVAAMRSGAPLDPQTVAITVDDGRRSQYTEMYPIVLRYKVPVTLFVYTDAVSYEPDALTWDEIEEMVKSGLVDVQSHTCSHPDFDKERARRRALDYEAFVAEELAQSKKTLEERLKRSVEFLAWPYGIFDRDLERAAAAAGYSAAFAVQDRPARADGDLFAVPRITVSDADRGERFERLLHEGAPARVASIDPLASCQAHGAPPAP
ncbi:MAG: polysaccharide deacetylase family protein [Roseiarcus sp.]